jgi:hypothetical protein
MYLVLVFCQWLGFSFTEEGAQPAKEILYG